MSMAPFNPFMGEVILTDAYYAGVTASWSQVAKITESPSAIGDGLVLAFTQMQAAPYHVTTGITNPDAIRNVSIKGNVSGITGNVVITGTDAAGAVLTNTIALSGTSTVAGTRPFATVTDIFLPAQTHTPTNQVETATVVAAAGITGSGNAKVIITAANLTGTPKTYSVPVLIGDTAAQVATKMIAVLQADAVLTALYTVSGIVPATVVLTSVAPQTNDSTLNIETNNDTCTGLTHETTSVHTIAGIPYDTVSVGLGNLLGLPYLLSRNTFIKTYLNNVIEGTAPTITFDPVNMYGNTMTLNSSLNGTEIDAYLFVP